MEHREVVLSFDPGWCTGIFLGWFNDETPLTKTACWAVPGGAEGLAAWLRAHHFRPDHIVSEIFIPDGSAGSRKTVSPRGEGVLIARFGESNIAWQLRSEKAWAGTRERGDEVIKRLGWWETGKPLDWEDGRDANDGTHHAIQYMRKMRPHHLPTIRLLYGEAPTT